MSRGILPILQVLAVPGDPQEAWERLAPALDALSLDELVELDYRIALDDADLDPGAAPSLKRRVVERILQRKLDAFIVDCFDPFVNPWVLEARMKALFWRLEFVRSLADQLEEIAEAHKYDHDLPWTVNGNLFGMANSALLAWHLGGWDDTVSGYGQGEPPPVLDFRPEPGASRRRVRSA
jgi:hypothetical protein